MEKKTPKSALKELSEKWKGFGAELLVFDSTPSTNVQGGFEYTCIFIKSATGPKFEGTCNCIMQILTRIYEKFSFEMFRNSNWQK